WGHGGILDVEVLGRTDLVRPVQGVQHERAVVAADRDETLAVTQRELRDGEAAGLLERLLEERIRLGRGLLRLEVVRRLDVELLGYLGLLDERGDVDGLAGAERQLLEVLVGQLDVAAFLVLVCALDIIPRDLVIAFLAPALVLDARLVLRAE